MAEGDGIQVTFLDQTGAKSVKAKISPTVEVKKIIPNIITKMQLPVTAPDGTPMSYSLDHKEGGKRLQEGQTLPGGGGAKIVSLDPGQVLDLPPGSGPVFTLNDAGDVAFMATDGLKWGIYLFSDRF